MTRKKASQIRDELRAQGKSQQYIDTFISKVMTNRAATDAQDNPDRAAKERVEAQGFAKAAARWNKPASGSGGNSGGSTPKPNPTPKPDPTQQLLQQQEIASASALIQQTLASWGLSDLSSVALQYLNQGLTADEVTLKLQQTAEYQRRFSGNAQRIANGLAPLSPADYIAAENNYQQVLNSYGLSAYSSHDEMAEMIGKNISANELDSRAQIAEQQYENAPDEIKNLWNTYFGTKGDAIAHILDPNVSTSTIQNQGTQVAIGGAAAQQGLGVSQARAQQLQQAGVTAQQAQQGYEQIAYELPTDQRIASRFGTTEDQSQIEDATLLN